MIRVPVPKISYSTSTLSLSGVSYLFTFRYNTRAKRWKIDVSLADGTVVYNGFSLVEAVPINSHLTISGLNEGFLMVNRLEVGDVGYASRDNLGVGLEFELIYTEYSELG